MGLAKFEHYEYCSNNNSINIDNEKLVSAAAIVTSVYRESHAKRRGQSRGFGRV